MTARQWLKYLACFAALAAVGVLAVMVVRSVVLSW